MRVTVHDYAGHPFQVELSRELARRGHDVLHLYSSAITGPRGALTVRPEDPPSFAVESIDLGVKLDRDRLFQRRLLEAEHGRRVVRRLAKFKPEVILSANTPLDAQRRILRYCRDERVGFAYWVQDLIGEAANRLLRERLIIGRSVAWYYRRLERRLLWDADAVIVISDDFLPYVPATAAVIENWAPLKDLPLEQKTNTWSLAHGLESSTNLLYSGTLGMKHDPKLLIRLAAAHSQNEGVRVIVASEGSAADWLREQREQVGVENLLLLPFQPYEALAKMHASADVLVAILEPDAGVFSVPSKVLSYLCAGRPLLLVVPPTNLAAKIVTETGAGVVIPPNKLDRLEKVVANLLASEAERTSMGERARAYAERTFDLDGIANRFEIVLKHALASSRPSLRALRATPEASLPPPALGRSANVGAQPPDTTIEVSVIIVSYECREKLIRCLRSLQAEQETTSLEVIVVDNASTDGTSEAAEAAFPWVRLTRSATNEGFARAANRGLRRATGAHVLLLNPDTVVPPGTLRATIDELDQRPDVAVLGCKLVRSDGTFDHASKRGLPTISSSLFYFIRLDRLFPRSRRIASYTAGHVDDNSAALVDAISGAFMLLRREALEDVGPMDERFWLYGEDLDWCMRFRSRGWRILYWPRAQVTHYKGASAAGEAAMRTQIAFHRSMWLYYDKHLAPRHSLAVNMAVRLGISAIFCGAFASHWFGRRTSRFRPRTLAGREHPDDRQLAKHVAYRRRRQD